jgi:hypothetical protein
VQALAGAAATIRQLNVRCAFFDRNLHSRMPLVPTPARLKRAGVRPMTFLSEVHSSYRLALQIRPNTEGNRGRSDWYWNACT